MISDYLHGSSPFDDATVITYEEGDVSLESNSLDISTTGNNIIHTVLEGQTLQNIAYKYYRDSGLWYVIAQVNGILNPFSDELYPGQQLNIPNYGS